jgi:hypothetical protein
MRAPSSLAESNATPLYRHKRLTEARRSFETIESDRVTEGPAMPKTRDLRGILRPVDDVPLIEVDIDDEWRERCNAKLASLRTADGQTLRQGDVAGWIKMGQPNFSEMLNMKLPLEDRPRRSSYAQRLSLAIGVALPLTSDLYLITRELSELGDQESLKATLLQLKTQLEWMRAKK